MIKITAFLMLLINMLSCSGLEENTNNKQVKLAVYEGDPVGKLTRIEENGRYGYKDEKNNIIVNPVYNQLPESPWEVMNVKIGPERGLINYMGDTLIEFGKYQELKIEHSLPLKRKDPNPHGVQYFSDEADWNMICKKDNKWGMINVGEKILLPIEFDEYKYIFDNKYAFSKEGEWIVINSKGEKITDLTFDLVYQIYKYSYFVYEKNNQQGAFDIKSNKDAIGLHDKVLALTENILGVQDKGKFTLYEVTGLSASDQLLDTLIVNYGNNAPVDASVLSRNNNPKPVAWAKIGGQYYFISKKGEVIELK